MVSENALFTACGVEQESCACTVNDDVPVPVGVPESKPLELSVRPAGTVPAITVHETGAMPPALVNWNEQGEFCVPGGNGEALVMLNGRQEIVMLNSSVLVL